MAWPRETLEPGQSVSVVTWNAGYGGLSRQADFFMDGGDGVRTVSHDGVLANLAGIEDELAALDPDFIFLQEVDQDSERTYGTTNGRASPRRLPPRTHRPTPSTTT